MADIIKKLTFTRDWRVNGTEGEGGFPTHESREEVVRADMQYLHEETKNHINEKLWPAVQELSDRQTVSFSHVPTIGANGNWQLWSEEQQKYVDSGVSAWQGNMDEALKTVAEEAASAVTPETLGVYIKEETLSDDTKTLYGLEETAKPDDVLEKIHEYVAEKAAYMVGQNATETTGFDGTEFCDVTTEGSLGTDGVGTKYGATATIHLDRLPENARLVRLPDFKVSFEKYEFNSSTMEYFYTRLRVLLNGALAGEGVISTDHACGNSFFGPDVIPSEAGLFAKAGRLPKRGDVITVEVLCWDTNTPISGHKAVLRNVTLTPENARYVEV